MLVYQTTNSLIAQGKLVELKLEVYTKKIKFCLLKNQGVDTYKNGLRRIKFSKLQIFEDVNQAYSDFFQKLMATIDSGAPCNTKQVEGKT